MVTKLTAHGKADVLDRALRSFQRQIDAEFRKEAKAAEAQAKQDALDLAFARKVREALAHGDLMQPNYLRNRATDFDAEHNFGSANLYRAIAAALEAEQEAAK